MEESIETTVHPQMVWAMWEQVHDLHAGKAGRAKFKYKIIDVKPGESFSILWKALFVKLVLTQTVKPSAKGSEICYRVAIKGLFAWLARWFLSNKIKKNLASALQATVKQMEQNQKYRV